MLACHDLRTPLATVHGFAQTLARSEELDETAARYVGMINAANRMAVITHQKGGSYETGALAKFDG